MIAKFRLGTIGIKVDANALELCPTLAGGSREREREKGGPNSGVIALQGASRCRDVHTPDARCTAKEETEPKFR